MCIRNKETLADNVLATHSIINEAKIGNNTSIGPFAHIRPESCISENSKIGNFVEIKKSFIGEGTKIKGRGLMLGLEFQNEVKELRKKLILEEKIFTGGSSNRNLIRILPPLTIEKKHIDLFFDSLKKIT